LPSGFGPWAAINNAEFKGAAADDKINPAVVRAQVRSIAPVSPGEIDGKLQNAVRP
jgi:hypothetical protein